jgi:ABC-type transporter Mla subunit MlaD
MDVQTLAWTSSVGDRRPDPRDADMHRGTARRLPEPALTLQMIEAAIAQQRVVEDEGERIFEQAQKLLDSVKAERERLRGEIAHLQADLAVVRGLLWETRQDLAAAELRADLAEQRAEDLAARNEDMTRFCVRLVDAVEPMLEQETGDPAEGEAPPR